MQRRTYCENAMALAEALGCDAECAQRLLHVVDCTLGIYHDGECLDFDALVASIPALPPAAHDLGGALHTPDTIADLNTRVTDATLFGLAHDATIKGWVQFNGTGVIAIQDSFNVAGIVDHGVGDYTVTWDTDFANNDYACVASAYYFTRISALATGSARFETYNDAGGTPSKADASLCSVIAIGDQ